MSGDAYRNGPITCARCGKEITTQVAVTAPWAPFASMCGQLGPGPYCFAQAEAQIKREYEQAPVIKKTVLDISDKPFFVVGAFLATAGGIALYALIATICASGRVAACYTNPQEWEDTTVKPHVMRNEVRLMGHVEWRQDHLLGTFGTFDEAVEGARKINCPLDVPRPQ